MRPSAFRSCFFTGALEVLAFCSDHSAPRAQEIHAAIKRWEQSLSWFRRWDWKLNRIEPPQCRVAIDFEAGEVCYMFSKVVLPIR
ncbi:hypothetical protein UC8_03870 [Roseimaritima ulvae]|uniref:Uncharacterized protein n=1 Tax=Roseimaritima ulvae TaxID=980254 RepID=A0A5B9QLG3_9BACT|nr:hypothetical protein UC8_03870 [Roseimaritima ulvae]